MTKRALAAVQRRPLISALVVVLIVTVLLPVYWFTAIALSPSCKFQTYDPKPPRCFNNDEYVNGNKPDPDPWLWPGPSRF